MCATGGNILPGAWTTWESSAFGEDAGGQEGMGGGGRGKGEGRGGGAGGAWLAWPSSEAPAAHGGLSIFTPFAAL